MRGFRRQEKDLPMSSNEIAIQVDGLGKCYEIYERPGDRLKQFILPHLRGVFGLRDKKYYRDFWALKDISFEVKKGETVGIIGKNGSGKSTLLQIICGTLSATNGFIQTNGRITALLELGSGFNPEFTGRENVYLSASLLGLSKKEIDKRYQEIISFADIGEFVEQPVKFYSSGMFVRLAFAVNMFCNPEIMIVDEALSVGDMAFQAKCITALRRLQRNGTTILFVSHDIGSIKSLCDKAIFLDNGKVQLMGDAPSVSEEYNKAIRIEVSVNGADLSEKEASLNLLAANNFSSDKKNEEKEKFFSESAHFRYGTGLARIEFAELVDLMGNKISTVKFNQKVCIRIYFISNIDVDISINYYIHDGKKNAILGAGPLNLGLSLPACKAGMRYVATYTTCLPLQDGEYSVHLELTRPLVLDETAEFFDVIDNAIVFRVNREPDLFRLWAKVFIENQFDIRLLEQHD